MAKQILIVDDEPNVVMPISANSHLTQSSFIG